MTFLRFIWCVFVSFLVKLTYGFDPPEFQERGRELARAKAERDRARVAFVRAKRIIERWHRQDAETWPSPMRAADPVTLPSMKAEGSSAYLRAIPEGDGVEVPR